MKRTRLLSLAALLVVAVLPFAGALPLPRAQGSAKDVEALLRSRVEAAAGLPVDTIWQEAATLEEILLDAGGEELDRLVDQLLREGEQLPDRGILLLAALRLSGSSPDLSLLHGTLTPLLHSPDQGVRRAAAGVFTDPVFKQLAEDEEEALIEALLDGAEEEDNAPETRLDFATVAYELGGGPAQRDARRVMLSYLQSSDPHLRALGALALAEVGDLETPQSVLEELAKEPGPEGRLAAAHLKNERLTTYYESRLRAQREKRAEASEDRPPPQDLEAVEAMIELIQDQHLEGNVADRKELIDAALDGMLHSLDQHSSYMNPNAYAKFQQELSGEYGGIGAYVNVDRSDQLFTITQPIYSGPAYKADLRTDDKIVKIDDWPTHEHGISKDQDEIIRRLKGEPGTDVKLYIWRQGMDPELIDRPTEEMAVTITRGFITIPTVHSELLPGGVGLVELTQFSGVATREVQSALGQLLAQGAKGMILDLRINPGGLLREAQGVADLFLPKGKLVVTTESRVQAPEKLYTEHEAILPEDMPLVVLISKYSASASEIVSGALQDQGRATLVGQRSFGKGSVQNLLRMGLDDTYRDENQNGQRDNWEPLIKDRNGNGEFDYAGRAKLTVARYLLPSGRSIHRELDEEGNVISAGGVTPDFFVDPKRLDAWRLEGMLELRDKGVVRDWVEKNFRQNEELYTRLAYDDGKDPDRYPGFDELYESLDTVLPREDVRYLVRYEARRLVQDERGAAFPRGDFEEDLQLQKGIDVVLGALGRSPYEIAEYRDTFDVQEDLTGRELARRRKPEGATDRAEDVRNALGLIAEARRDAGHLSEEGLEKLTEILSRLDK